jgi:hypothetical protein
MMVRGDDKTSIATRFNSLNDFYRYRDYLYRKYGKEKTDALFEHMYVVESDEGAAPELTVRRRRRGKTVYQGGRVVHAKKKG